LERPKLAKKMLLPNVFIRLGGRGFAVLCDEWFVDRGPKLRTRDGTCLLSKTVDPSHHFILEKLDGFALGRVVFVVLPCKEEVLLFSSNVGLYSKMNLIAG
jgi:hypothetical protein